MAIDGLAGTGKSTLASLLAQELGLAFLDTGATYRAVALLGLRKNIDTGDPQALITEFHAHEVRFEDRYLFIDGHDASSEIRRPAVSAAASQVAVHPQLRQVLVAWQRQFVKDHGGAVAEGRDVGTVVLPQASLKVFLYADEEVRIQRRAETPSLELIERDTRDSTRSAHPVVPAADAILLETSEREIAELVRELEGLYWLASGKS